VHEVGFVMHLYWSNIMQESIVLSHKFHVWKFFSIIPFFPMLNSNYWEVGKVRNSNSIFMKVTLANVWSIKK